MWEGEGVISDGRRDERITLRLNVKGVCRDEKKERASPESETSRS